MFRIPHEIKPLDENFQIIKYIIVMKMVGDLSKPECTNWNLNTIV